MSQVVHPPVNYFHVQLQPIGPGVFALLLRTPAAKLRLELQPRSWRRRWCRGCWCPAKMLRDVPDEAMPKLFDVRKCHRVKHALPSPMQSSSDILFLLRSRKTLNSTDHRTEHFPMGGANCCVTFRTHEFLFLFPVGGSKIVTVAKFLFFCPCSPERRASHSEMVASPYPPLAAQGALFCFGLCSWLSPQTTQLKTTSSLTCEAKICSSSSPE